MKDLKVFFFTSTYLKQHDKITTIEEKNTNSVNTGDKLPELISLEALG